MTSRRLLRRTTEPSLSLDISGTSELQEAILMEPPTLYPERSLVGSLPLHQCARSTFSAVSLNFSAVCLNFAAVRFNFSAVILNILSSRRV